MSLNRFRTVEIMTTKTACHFRPLLVPGTAQQVFEWGGGEGGAKEECVKENFFVKLFFI